MVMSPPQESCASGDNHGDDLDDNDNHGDLHGDHSDGDHGYVFSPNT